MPTIMIIVASNNRGATKYCAVARLSEGKQRYPHHSWHFHAGKYAPVTRASATCDSVTRVSVTCDSVTCASVTCACVSCDSVTCQPASSYEAGE